MKENINVGSIKALFAEGVAESAAARRQGARSHRQAAPSSPPGGAVLAIFQVSSIWNHAMRYVLT